MTDEIEIEGEGEGKGKEWYKSKTVWVNVLTLVALLAQTQTGFIVSPDEQIGILAVINLILRIVTSQGLK